MTPLVRSTSPRSSLTASPDRRPVLANSPTSVASVLPLKGILGEMRLHASMSDVSSTSLRMRGGGIARDLAKARRSAQCRNRSRGKAEIAAQLIDYAGIPVTSGLNLTENRRFEFAVAAAAGAVDRVFQDGEEARRFVRTSRPDRALRWRMMRPRRRGRDGPWGPP
jgi:hypothetical protein